MAFRRTRRKTPSRKRRLSRAPVRRTRARTSTTPRRKKRASTSRGSVTGDKRHVMGYLNPFVQGGDLKIPDGSVTESHGQSHKVSQVIAIPAGTESTDIVLYPGLQAGVAIWDGSTANNLGWLNDSHFLFTGGEKSLDGPQEFGVQSPIAKWRLVSQGLHISLLNPRDSDDGYFQAIHVRSRPTTENFEIAGSVTDPPMQLTANGRFTPNAALCESFRGNSIAVEKSFISGPLRSIDKVIFSNGKMEGDHEWHDIENYYHFELSELADIPKSGGPPGEGFFYPGNGSRVGQNLVETMIDGSFDMVYIRIYGSSVPDIQTKLLMTLQANHEYVYQDSSALSKFMTKAPVASAATMSAATKAKMATS